MIAAEGSCEFSKAGTPMRIRVGMAEEARRPLSMIHSIIPSKWNEYQPRQPEYQRMVRLDLYETPFPWKVQLLEFANDIFENNWLRGLFDGNGCLTYTGGKPRASYVVANHEWWIAEFLLAHFPQIKSYARRSAPVTDLEFRSGVDSVEFASWLYGHSTLAIPRKIRIANHWRDEYLCST